MFKETVVVGDEFVEKFRKVDIKDYDYITMLFEDESVTKSLPYKFTRVIEGFAMEANLDEYSITNVFDNELFMEYYSDRLHPEDDLVCEIAFRNPYKKFEELGMAYLSVYRIEVGKIEKHSKVDITVGKWITDNKRR